MRQAHNEDAGMQHSTASHDEPPGRAGALEKKGYISRLRIT